MDLATLMGVAGVIALVSIAIITGQVSGVFLNFHGLFVIYGGVTVALLLNTPLGLFGEAIKAVFVMFRGSKNNPDEIIPMLISASQNVHARGLTALGGLDQKAAGGFLTRAATIAMEFKDPDYVLAVLENEVNVEKDHQNEVVNVYRTASILFPMFGLIGTLIGIVDVLKDISNPEQVGPAMAVAITSAFYGILSANLFATPFAGKIRLRFMEEYYVKCIIVDGIHQMLKGTVPVLVERRLQGFSLEKR